MIRSHDGADPEAFRDARAEAWRFALACLAENRREAKKAAPNRRPKDARERIKDARTHANCT